MKLWSCFAIVISASLVVAAPPDAKRSAEALTALDAVLKKTPATLEKIDAEAFASVPLTQADAEQARALIWKAHTAIIKKDRAEELRAKILTHEKLQMPIFMKKFGEKPKDGWSLYISMHGGGGAPKSVNDGQWENQKNLYKLEEGIYLAPRAPTNTWNLWHESHIDILFTRLIEDLIVLEEVNPNRIYIMGYSAGGDGVYQLAPRMADRWAAAAMMAGHPNGLPLTSLRNVPFALQVGEKDAAYKRNEVAKEYGEKLIKLKEGDPKGYEHFVKIHENKGHWMNLEDKVAIPWMAKFTRNPIPDVIAWQQTGTYHDRSYWLALPKKEFQPNALVMAKRDGQTITISKAERIEKLFIRLDDRMLDLDKPITVKQNNDVLYEGTPPRTIGVLLRTLIGRGDPKLMFDAEVSVEIRAAK